MFFLDCFDENKYCSSWARMGYCSNDPYTIDKCRLSCGVPSCKGKVLLLKVDIKLHKYTDECTQASGMLLREICSNIGFIWWQEESVNMCSM